MNVRYRICTMALLGFLLGVHNGQLALWNSEDPEPARVFPYAASLLPPADQAALRRGIPVESPEDLSRLLEDFSS